MRGALHPRSRTALAVVAAVLSGGAVMAGTAAPPSAELAHKIDAYVAPFLADGHLSGNLLVARGGEILYEGSFGEADMELGVPVTPDTRFNVASITKPMTAVIAARLIEAGKLGLADPLSRWLPAFPRAGEITVEHLVRHQAGIPHRVTTPEQEAIPRSTRQMVELAAAAGLDFEPGSRTSYSSGGYSVLARVLELAGGASYAELLAEHVFGPARMTDSVHAEGYRLIPHRARSYLIGPDGGVRNAALKEYSYLVGAGSVFSTARDLRRFVGALVSGAFGELARQAWVREGDVRLNGRTDGYRAFADYDGESELAVVFTSNLLTGAGDRLRRDLPRLVAGEDVATPARQRAVGVAVPEEVLRRYEGTYRLGSSTDLVLTVREGAVDLSGWTLIPTSPTTFFSPQDYARVSVVMGESGEVERLDWQQGDETYPVPRVDG